MVSPQIENGYTKIANEIMETLAKIRINGEARQMLDVIIRKTYGFNKKQDRISTSQFVEATGLPKYAIHKSRHKLLKMGIIMVLPKKVTGITQKGNSQILTYSFQKDYTKWKPLPKKVTVTQKGNALLPKKVTNCNPKSDTQKKERQYTKDSSITQQYFYSTYKQTVEGDYVANFGKDGSIFKDLSEVIPLDELKTLVDRFFASKDPFIKQSGYTVGVFKSQINKLRSKPLEKETEIL